MSLLDLSLDGTSLVDTVEAVSGATVVVTRANRPLAGEIRADFVDVPGRDGAWAFDDNDGELVLTFDLSVLVDSIPARRVAINALRGWFRTQTGRKQLIISDEPDRYWDAKIPSAGSIEDDEYEGTATIQFSCRPFAFSTTPSTAEETANSNPDSDTFEAALSYDAEPVVEITPTDGTITSFTLTVNGAQIAWQVDDPGDPNTLVQDNTITISSISQTVTLASNDDMELTGVFDPDDVDMANVAITGFPEIVDGTNSWSLSWTGTATSVDIDFAWRERYT